MFEMLCVLFQLQCFNRVDSPMAWSDMMYRKKRPHLPFSDCCLTVAVLFSRATAADDYASGSGKLQHWHMQCLSGDPCTLQACLSQGKEGFVLEGKPSAFASPVAATYWLLHMRPKRTAEHLIKANQGEDRELADGKEQHLN